VASKNAAYTVLGDLGAFRSQARQVPASFRQLPPAARYRGEEYLHPFVNVVITENRQAPAAAKRFERGPSLAFARRASKHRRWFRVEKNSPKITGRASAIRSSRIFRASGDAHSGSASPPNAAEAWSGSVGQKICMTLRQPRVSRNLVKTAPSNAPFSAKNIGSFCRCQASRSFAQYPCHNVEMSKHARPNVFSRETGLHGEIAAGYDDAVPVSFVGSLCRI